MALKYQRQNRRSTFYMSIVVFDTGYRTTVYVPVHDTGGHIEHCVSLERRVPGTDTNQ